MPGNALQQNKYSELVLFGFLISIIVSLVYREKEVCLLMWKYKHAAFYICLIEGLNAIAGFFQIA